MKFTPKQLKRLKKLTPQYHASLKYWILDIPAGMNNGKWARRFFRTVEEANKALALFKAGGNVMTAKRTKRITPCYWPAWNAWIVDVLKNANQGFKGGRVFFDTQVEADVWIENLSEKTLTGLGKKV